MAGLLQRLGFRASRTGRPASGLGPHIESLAPGTAFAAIGDVHGCLDQLTALLERLDADYPEIEIICVGDLVDRGEHSAQVLRLLQERQAQAPQRLQCLRGNHEAMLLGFLDDPLAKADRWLRNGGLQTLASFGISLRATKDPERLRDDLIDAMGPELIAWVRGLPLLLQRGNVAILHAAADPDLPMEEQSERVLLWGHPRFKQVPRADGLWVVHGHTIVDAPEAREGRIAVDTGAYGTGRLTAAVVAQGQLNFVTT